MRIAPWGNTGTVFVSLKQRTVSLLHIVINRCLPKLSKASKPKELFSDSEVTWLDESILEGKNREQLLVLQKKLQTTFEWLGVGERDMDDQAFGAWEKNIQKLESLIEQIDEMNAETERPEESLGEL